MRRRTLRQRLAGTMMVAVLVAGGLGLTAGATQAAPAGNAGNATVSAAAGYWGLQGIFPDPISCHIAGIASGREYICTWYVLVWALNVWQE
jgi:hypothetical protein